MPDVGSVLPMQSSQSGPLDTIKSLMELSGGMQQLQQQRLQTQQLEQQQKARMALGPIFQRNIGEDGELDAAGVALEAAQNPDTAWMSMDLAKFFLDQNKLSADVLNTQLGNSKNLREIMNANYRPLMALGDAVKKDDYLNQAGAAKAQLEAAGLWNAKTQRLMIQDLASIKDVADGPELRQLLRGRAYQSMSASEALDRFSGKLQQVDTGGEIQLRRVSEAEGTNQLIGTVSKTLTPSEALENVETGITTEGDTQLTPKGQVAQRLAAGVPVNGAGAGQIPVAPGAPPGSFVRPGPLTTEEFKNAATFRQTLNQAVSDTQQSMLLIDEARQLMTEFTPTAGRSMLTTLAGYAKTAGLPDSLVDKLSGGDLPSAQVFRALATQFAFGMQRQFLRNTGAWSDREMEAFQKANPSLDTDPQAIEKLMVFMEHQAELVRRQQEAYEDYRAGGGDPRKWQAEWAKVLEDSGAVMYAPRRRQ